MSIAEELEADQDPRVQCRLCAWLSEQPPEVQAEWDAAIASRRYTHKSIYRALTRREVRLAKTTVENHRTGRHRQVPITPGAD